MSSFGVFSLMVIVAALLSPVVQAQERFFPAGRSFELPEASPRVYGLVGRLISASRGDSRFGQQREGEVVVGENIPVVTLREGQRPIMLGLGTQVYGRFSLADSKSALISTDWVVGVNTTAALTPWIVTLELFHESSHLGDEYGDRFPADRLDWSREAVAGWASYVTGSWRITGGTSYTLVDQLDLPAWSGSFGVDFHGGSRRFLGGQVRPIAALFAEAREATSWRVSTSAKLGMAFSADGTHGFSIGLIAHDGLSTQRQFFRQESQYLGVELRFDL